MKKLLIYFGMFFILNTVCFLPILFAVDDNPTKCTNLGGTWDAGTSKCKCDSAKASDVTVEVNQTTTCAEKICKGDDSHKPIGTWNNLTKKCSCKSYDENVDSFWKDKEVLFNDKECLFLDIACTKSNGTWDNDYFECACVGLYYRNEIGYCSKMIPEECGNGEWSPSTGCTCDETKGYYFKLGKCITAKVRCTDSGGTWEADAKVGDDDFESTKFTVGKCECAKNFLDDGGECKLASLVCTESGGTWEDSKCWCPSKKMESNGKCIAIPESAERTLCEGDSGIWNPSSLTCDCGVNREWDGASCIPVCGKDKYWTGVACADKDAAADTTKVKCSLHKDSEFKVLYILFAGLFSFILIRKRICLNIKTRKF